MRFFVSILYVLLSVGAVAQSGGQSAFTFLKLTNSAHVAGLGGTNVSLLNAGADFAFHNPALLTDTVDKQINLNYVGYFAGVRFGYASYAFSAKKIGVFSGGIHYVNYGTFIGADETGVRTGEFGASDYAFNLIWSKELLPDLNVGVNLKPVYSHLESYTSYALASDIGLTYFVAESGFGAGLSLVNIGRQIKPYYSDTREPLPFDILLGVSKRLAHAPFRVHLTAHHLYTWDLTDYEESDEEQLLLLDGEDADPEKGKKLLNVLDNGFRHFIVAVEFLPVKSFYASVAYNHMRKQELSLADRSGMTGFSFGFGLQLNKIGIKYARQSYHLAGGANHFSLSLNLNRFIKH